MSLPLSMIIEPNSSLSAAKFLAALLLNLWFLLVALLEVAESLGCSIRYGLTNSGLAACTCYGGFELAEEVSPVPPPCPPVEKLSLIISQDYSIAFATARAYWLYFGGVSSSSCGDRESSADDDTCSYSCVSSLLSTTTRGETACLPSGLKSAGMIADRGTGFVSFAVFYSCSDCVAF